MTRPPGMRLADYVRELIEPHTHREHYTVRVHGSWRGRDHVTKVPPLLAQLWANDVHSSSAEDGPRPGFASKPAARLEALDAAARIDVQASRWITDLGEQPRSLSTDDIIRQLHGLAASADDVTRRAIERSVRSWWTQARIVTGWDSPAWSPDNTCPSCGERGTLKIRLAEHIGMCTAEECRATWEPETIGLLADHIRAESMAERAPSSSAGPCWCPWPKPRVENLAFQCPACGSARCTHALRRRLVDALRAGADAPERDRGA